MPVVKTPRAIIDVLGAPDVNGNYPITGHEIECFYTWDGEGAELFTPKTKRDEATEEEVNALRQASSALLTSTLQAQSAQIADQQAQIADLTNRLKAARNALIAVADADVTWDASPRAQVVAVLQAEGL